jgi:Raf kinase inhibitor-like YbhB/YbcL family protein
MPFQIRTKISANQKRNNEREQAMTKTSFVVHSDAISQGLLSHEYGINNTSSLREGVPTISFPISWKNPPVGTASFALVFLDYDNVEDEGVCWIHWLVADIPANVGGLSKDESRTNPRLIQGSNSWALPYGPYEGISQDLICHYGGPAPGRSHEYECTLYALDCLLGLTSGFYLNHLRKAMDGHILAKAKLKMQYNPD